jgi:hypothetical protein
MGQVIDFGAWRRARSETSAAEAHPAVRARLLRSQGEPPEGSKEPGNGETAARDRELEMLDGAVQRLHLVVSQTLGHGHQLEGRIETELLAIMGELTVGLVVEATRRAERLADRLAAGDRAGS